MNISNANKITNASSRFRQLELSNLIRVPADLRVLEALGFELLGFGTLKLVVIRRLELVVLERLELVLFHTVDPVDVDVAVGVGAIGPSPERMIAPRSNPLPVVVGSGTMLVPTTRPDGPRDTGVPDKVTAGPPTDRVVPPNATLPDLI